MVQPVVDWESDDLAELAHYDQDFSQFTWSCPRPQPFPIYPLGTPVSASQSSTQANRNTGPGRGRKQLQLSNISIKC